MKNMEILQLSKKRKLFILAICSMSILIVGLDISILNVALPSIQKDLHASIAGAQWTIDAYTFILASLLLLSGSTADKIGRKRTFSIGLVVFTTGSFLCSVAPSIHWLIAFRMLQAIGGSMLNPVALSIISNTFVEPKARARAIGVWSGVIGISIAAGPIIGGTLVDSVGWRSIFWLNIPVGIAAYILTRLFIPESKAIKSRRLDPIGQVLIIIFLATLIYGIIEAPVFGLDVPTILGSFTIALLSFVSLIFYESKRVEPLIDLRFFRSAPFSGASIVAVSAFTAMGGFLFLNTLYLQDVRGFAASQAGFFLLPMAGAMFLLGPISGYVVGKFGSRIPLIIGSVFLCLAALIFISQGTVISNSLLFFGYACIGIGLGVMNAAITNTAVSGMPRSQAGVASATTSTTRQIGQALGVAIIGSVLASNAHRIMPGLAFSNGFHVSWLIIGGCGIVVFIVALVTTGTWAKKTAERAAILIEAEEKRQGFIL